MEGVTDAPLRALMSERGGFTHCVSEFLRVSQEVPPGRTILEHIPELRTGARTAAGIPVQVQLLGGDAERLAATALRAIQVGAQGIDLNFGCPAPTVNRHDGGATLLKYPDRIREIVGAVRRAVPAEYPVSAKLRLGWDTIEPIHLNADRAAEGGASWITIHARTRMQAYQPPVYWRAIGEVRRRLSATPSGGIPVIANGDIWTIEDLRECRDITQCEHFMLGRGALANPSLPHLAARELGIAIPGGPDPRAIDWRDGREWVALLRRFDELCLPYAGHKNFTVSRVKQWTRLAHLRTPTGWFDELKRLSVFGEMIELLETGSGR